MKSKRKIMMSVKARLLGNQEPPSERLVRRLVANEMDTPDSRYTAQDVDAVTELILREVTK